MNSLDPKLDKLFALAGTVPEDRPHASPPGFAKRVVRTWLVNQGQYHGGSWNRVARIGLALAGAAAVVSVAINSRIWHGSLSPEEIAAESVVWFALPR